MAERRNKPKVKVPDAPPDDPKGKAIVLKMRPWFRAKDGKNRYPDMRIPPGGERTPEQKIWDHAIFAASEFVRRYEGHNKGISRSVHLLLSDYLPPDDEVDGSKET